MAKSERLYRDSPRMERDKESGEMGVVKGGKPADVGEDGSSAEMSGGPVDHAHERREMKHRHVAEHLAMHHRHEVEHGSSKAPKEEIHKRHEEETKGLHAKHEKEIKAMHKRHEEGAAKGGEKEVKKIEKAE